MTTEIITKRWHDYLEGYKDVKLLNHAQAQAALSRAIRDIKLLKEELEKTATVIHN